MCQSRRSKSRWPDGTRWVEEAATERGGGATRGEPCRHSRPAQRSADPVNLIDGTRCHCSNTRREARMVQEYGGRGRGKERWSGREEMGVELIPPNGNPDRTAPNQAGRRFLPFPTRSLSGSGTRLTSGRHASHKSTDLIS